MFLGMFAAFLGCSASQVHKERKHNRSVQKLFAEQRARGEGMRLPDGEVMPWGISEAEWKVMHEEWLRTHKK